MEPLLLLVIFISFFCTFLALPFWIRKAKEIGLLWEDVHKGHSKKNIAGSGGVAVVFGFMIGIFLYIALQTFYFKSSDGTTLKIFAMLSSIFLVAGIGLIDDLFGWQKGGMSNRSRIILVFFAAIPLMVINAGVNTANIPIFGAVNFGILYALIIIPLGIVGATTTFNFLAGANGLESGQGILLLGALSIVTFITGNSYLSIISLSMVASLFAFYIFNMYPAKVFPGDILTYSIGVLIATIAILGNIERIAIFFFIPYIIEFILKTRGKLKKMSLLKSNLDGSLEERYDKVYSLNHLALKLLKKIKPSKKVYEYEIVYSINLFQFIIIILGFIIFL